MARTTLIIPDALWRELKLKAAKDNQTISEWVAGAVSAKLRPAKSIPPTRKKFEDWCRPRPLGPMPDVITREWIYGPATDDPKTWR